MSPDGNTVTGCLQPSMAVFAVLHNPISSGADYSTKAVFLAQWELSKHYRTCILHNLIYRLLLHAQTWHSSPVRPK